MLFLGSKKYPDENFYEINLKKHGGSSNAYTDTFETVYYFSVFNNSVELVLDIFSRFFIDPLFDHNAVNREINAVNSEHMKNINDDHWRLFQLMRNLASKDNKYNSFATGSKETMNEHEIRDEMIKFYNKYYVSENITIVIISNLNIKTQQKMINNTFGKIEKKSAEKIIIEKPVYNNFNKTYQMIPLSDIQQLIYIYEIDHINLKNKLYNILNDILVSGYKNSLLNHLKLLGYIESIFINIDEQIGIFSIYFQLTKIGLNKLNEIDGYLKFTLNQIFKAFNNIKNINTYYKKIYELNFNYTEKADPQNLSIYLANNSHIYEPNEIYSGPHLIIENNTRVPNKFFNYFNKCIKLLVSSNKLFKNDNNLKDQNYGTIYGEIDNINGDELKFDFEINLHNDFIDMNPQLINVETIDNVPITIRDKVWFASINKFNETIIKGGLIFNNSKLFNNEYNYLLTQLAIGCLSFYLNQELFNILSLDFNIDVISKPVYNSIILSYSCLNDPFKFNHFVDLTIKKLSNPNIPQIIFDSKIKAMKENLLNTKKENPWSYINYYFNQLVISTEYSIENLIKVIDTLKLNDLNKHISNIFIESSLSMLFVGNMTKDQIPNNNIINKLLFNPQHSLPIITFPNNKSIQHPNLEEKSNCVKIVYYIGDFEPLRWVHSFFIYLILESPFFEELRTKKQLGYLVKFMLNNNGNNYYIVQQIQSDKCCNIIKEEINTFNLRILDIIKNSNLNEWIISAKNYIDEKDNNTGDIFNKFFTEILSRKYLFNRRKILLAQLDKISIESLLSFVKQFILENDKVCILEVNGN